MTGARCLTFVMAAATAAIVAITPIAGASASCHNYGSQVGPTNPDCKSVDTSRPGQGNPGKSSGNDNWVGGGTTPSGGGNSGGGGTGGGGGGNTGGEMPNPQ